MSVPTHVGDAGGKLPVETYRQERPKTRRASLKEGKILSTFYRSTVTGCCFGGPHTTVLMA